MACLQERSDLAQENFQVRQGVSRELPQGVFGQAAQFRHTHVSLRPRAPLGRQSQFGSEFCRGHVVPIPRSEKLPSS